MCSEGPEWWHEELSQLGAYARESFGDVIAASTSDKGGPLLGSLWRIVERR